MAERLEIINNGDSAAIVRDKINAAIQILNAVGIDIDPESIESNAALGFQSIHDVQTNQTLRAYRDRPLELVIDKTLIRVTFNDELHQMMIDPLG